MKKKGGILVLIVVIIAVIVFGIWITSEPSMHEENVEINLKGLSFDKDTSAEGEPCEVKLVGKTYIDSTNSKYFDVRLAGYQEDPDKGGVWIDGEKTELMTLVLSNNGEEFTVSGSTLTDENDETKIKLEFAADADLEFLIICSYDENGEIDRLIVTPAETKDDALKLIDELLPKVIGELNIQTVEEWKALLE